MQAFFEWLFADGWRFLQFVIILIIAVQWRPVSVNVTHEYWKGKDDEDKAR